MRQFDWSGAKQFIQFFLKTRYPSYAVRSISNLAFEEVDDLPAQTLFLGISAEITLTKVATLRR